MVQGDRNVDVQLVVTASDGSMPVGQVVMTYVNFGSFVHTLINGATQYTLYSLPVGTYVLQASFPAQGKYAASISATHTLVVTGSAPTTHPVPPQLVHTTISFTAPTTMVQGDRSIGAFVTVTAADGSVPSGQVVMTYSNFGSFIHTLVNGSTEYTLYSLPVGTYVLQATYPAQGKYTASITTTHVLTVQI